MHQISTGRCSNSSLQLLLKPDISPRTIPIKQHACRLPAGTWGRGTRTCPGHSCCHEEQREPTERRRLVRASGTAFARSTAYGQQRYAGAPHTSPGSWFTRTINQVVRSRCSEVSCKWLLTDLKNYPIYLHPSRRYRGR